MQTVISKPDPKVQQLNNVPFPLLFLVAKLPWRQRLDLLPESEFFFSCFAFQHEPVFAKRLLTIPPVNPCIAISDNFLVCVQATFPDDHHGTAIPVLAQRFYFYLLQEQQGRQVFFCSPPEGLVEFRSINSVQPGFHFALSWAKYF